MAEADDERRTGQDRRRPEVWRRVLGFYTEERRDQEPGKQLQHMAVLIECSHEVPVGHGEVPAQLRCPTCEAALGGTHV